MSFLGRAEDVYLNVLRVVILAIATLAILIAVLGLAFGGWGYLKYGGAGGPHAPPVSGVTLGDYVSEQKAAAQSASSSGPAGDAASATTPIPESIAPAVRDITAYGNSHGMKLTTADVSDPLGKILDGIPEPYKAAYAESLNSLAHQIFVSKGAALSVEQLNALLEWHKNKFMAAIADDRSSRTLKALTAAQLLTVGGVAFLAFMLLIFCFIFVKIERNLRVVKTLTRVSGVVN